MRERWLPWSLAAPWWLLALVAFVFWAPVTGCLLLLATLSVARSGGRALRAIVFLVALGVAVPSALVEYPRRVDPLAARVKAHGPGTLSLGELASIWVLNLTMAAGGALCGFPEVALETALLVVPGGGVRTFPSAFPAGSTRVAAVLDDYDRLSREVGVDWQELPERRIVFSYSGGHAEQRRGLALNPFTLRGRVRREGATRVFELEGRVPVDYPPEPTLHLFWLPTGSIGVHEGLFDALEQRGWLFPYEGRWTWTVRTPDA